MKQEIESLLGRMAQGGDWHAFRKEIADLHERATTEEEHVALLEAHRVLVAVGKECLDEASYTKLLQVANAEYRLFLNKEATEDGLVNPVLLDRITRREVAAGRLAPNDNLRTLAAAGASVLGDSTKITAHRCKPGDWFFYGMGLAAFLALALENAHVSPLWLIALGLIVGWFLNERERKHIDSSIDAKRK
ncbi:hypothetical protein [Cupriavidus pinatubonensis]|uniref:Transmembrane protein n=1 Tax=Cupriavidus pinatubonensis TaxID=248026 RepID=A0ABN7Y910_9BURK|nr:hypothetical protein [Cupriavidus pinatubonensis]CAG9169733.1 hypothetical protein LMG23994_01636 [Cupriavidus pinatubonensis]